MTMRVFSVANKLQIDPNLANQNIPILLRKKLWFLETKKNEVE